MRYVAIVTILGIGLLFGAALGGLVSCAMAQQPRDISLPLSVEDQKNFREICGAAMRNDHVATETTYSIAAWCLTMSNRIVQVAVTPVAPKSEDAPK